MMRRDTCLAALLAHHNGEVVAAVYGAAFDLLRMQPDPLLFVSFGAMGLLSSQALGIALGRPDKRIIVLDGDGGLWACIARSQSAAPRVWAPPSLRSSNL